MPIYHVIVGQALLSMLFSGLPDLFLLEKQIDNNE